MIKFNDTGNHLIEPVQFCEVVPIVVGAMVCGCVFVWCSGYLINIVVSLGCFMIP